MILNIRCGELNDVELLSQFQIKMALETENLRLDPLIVLNGVVAVMKDPSKGRYWVAEFEGKIIGCLLIVPEWSDWRNGAVLWIHSVYVTLEYRKQGVYKKLYEHLKKIVQDSSDLRGLRLYVDKTNFKAQKIYESLGMSGEHYHLYEWMKEY